MIKHVTISIAIYSISNVLNNSLYIPVNRFEKEKKVTVAKDSPGKNFKND